jgi:hypothetical protein
VNWSSKKNIVAAGIYLPKRSSSNTKMPTCTNGQKGIVGEFLILIHTLRRMTSYFSGCTASFIFKHILVCLLSLLLLIWLGPNHNSSFSLTVCENDCLEFRHQHIENAQNVVDIDGEDLKNRIRDVRMDAQCEITRLSSLSHIHFFRSATYGKQSYLPLTHSKTQLIRPKHLKPWSQPTYESQGQTTRQPLHFSRQTYVKAQMFKWRGKRMVNEVSYHLAKATIKLKSVRVFFWTLTESLVCGISWCMRGLHWLTSVTPSKAYRGCIAGDGPHSDGTISEEMVDLVSVYCALAKKVSTKSKRIISDATQVPFTEVLSMDLLNICNSLFNTVDETSD